VSALERYAIGAMAGLLVLFAAWLWHRSEVNAAHERGYSEAVAAAEIERDLAAEESRRKERVWRDAFVERNEKFQHKEQGYETALADAQRRVRAGTDRLYCPASNPVQASTAPADRSIPVPPEGDGAGTPVVPEVAADILGLAAATGKLVRKLDEAEELYNACRALNNGSSP
jgi:hypothetical protein